MATVDQLDEQIRDAVALLARRAVRLYRLRAVLWVASLILVATMVFVAVDYGLHVEERGWRWMWSVLWLTALCGISGYWLPDASRFRLNSIQVANWIERRRPELGDALSRFLAVGELPVEDPRFGSLEFRQAAVRNFDARLSQIPWHTFIERKPTIWAAVFLIVSVLTAGVIALSAGPVARQGIMRIVRPWSWAPWPRSEQLQLLDPPALIARDSELEVHVVDLHPPFPEIVELEMRTPGEQAGDRPTNMRVPMRVVSDMAVVTLPAMAGDFSIRPLGGDQQDGPWHDVRVTRQPLMKEYAFTVQTPEYVGQPASELVGQRIDVLSGSRVTLRGKFDERLKSLTALSVADSKSQVTESSSEFGTGVTGTSTRTEVWPAVLSSDGLSFELFHPSDAASLVQQDRRWQFQLETVDGLQLIDSKQWMIHVTADRPPAVALAPIEPRSITRSAALLIRGSATDDLGLTEVNLTWHLPNQTSQSMPLWTRSEKNNDNSVTSETNTNSVRSVDLSSPWSIAAAALSPGQSVTVELVARDSAGQVGMSVPQTLEVLDDAAALAILQRRQAEAFGPLRQLLESQKRNQQALNRTVEMVRQLDDVAREQVDAVAAAQQLGQSIAGSLDRNQDSITHQLQELSEQLNRNQLGETPLAGEVARLSSKIESLVNSQMAPALTELDAAQKAMAQAHDRSDREQVLSLLSKATQLNQKATDQLNELVESVAVAESLAEFQKQIQEMASDQAAVAAQTERHQLETVVRGNSSQASATRVGIQSDQQNLARRIEEMAGRLEKELEPDSSDAFEPSTRKLIDKAHKKLLERRIGDQMRKAAELIQNTQLTEAHTLQLRIGKQLDEVVSELGGANSSGLESSSESMQDLARQLNQVAAKQLQTAETLKRAASAGSPDVKQNLISQQQSVLNEVSLLSSSTSVQGNQRLHDMLENASSAIEQSLQQSEQDKLNDASQSAQRAAESLNAAAQTAQQRAEQLKEQVTAQQLLDLQVLFSSAIKRQLPVVNSLEKAISDQEKARQSQEHSSPAPNVNELLSTEQQLQQLLSQGRQRLQASDTFDWLLGQCDDELLRTVASLERQRLDSETLASAQAALAMMQAAQTAVTEAANSERQASDGNLSEKQPSDASKSQLPTLASLRLLRQMQLLINQQSEQAIKSPNTSTSAVERMANRQQSLAEQVARMREQLKKSQ